MTMSSDDSMRGSLACKIQEGGEIRTKFTQNKPLFAFNRSIGLLAERISCATTKEKTPEKSVGEFIKCWPIDIT